MVLPSTPPCTLLKNEATVGLDLVLVRLHPSSFILSPVVLFFASRKKEPAAAIVGPQRQVTGLGLFVAGLAALDRYAFQIWTWVADWVDSLDGLAAQTDMASRSCSKLA
jgi:hypothetical protein